MKVAVINFSGNVGKSTVARHLLLPRIENSVVVAVESINSNEGDGPSLRGAQFAELQRFLQIVPSAIVDIGASNVEDLLLMMRRFEGSEADFDYFVVPTVAAIKQQKDTVATLQELARLGAPASRVKVVFNMVEHHSNMARDFEPLLSFVQAHALAEASIEARLGINEIYEVLRSSQDDLRTLAADSNDYKRMIASAGDMDEKLALAHKLAVRRLAKGVIPELDACFAALGLEETVQ